VESRFPNGSKDDEDEAGGAASELGRTEIGGVCGSTAGLEATSGEVGTSLVTPAGGFD
jgi:hypothetical protein